MIEQQIRAAFLAAGFDNFDIPAPDADGRYVMPWASVRIWGSASRLRAKLREHGFEGEVEDGNRPNAEIRFWKKRLILHGVVIAESDYPHAQARAANANTTWDPEGRAQLGAEDYVKSMRRFAGFIDTHGDGDAAKAETVMRSYKGEYLKRVNALLEATSRTASWHVTGRSGFNARSNEKKSQIAHNRLEELVALTRGAEARAKRAFLPDGVTISGAITSDADDAIERLEAKVAELVALQDTMKAANRIVRSKKLDHAAKVAKLTAIGVGEHVLTPGPFGDLGFPKYRLSSNSATIRNTRKRIEALKAERANPEREYRVEAAGLTVHDDPESNRIRLDFDSKPSAEVIAQLKANGFKWSRRAGVWQRLRNNNARMTIRRLGWGPPEPEPPEPPPAAPITLPTPQSETMTNAQRKDLLTQYLRAAWAPANATGARRQNAQDELAVVEDRAQVAGMDLQDLRALSGYQPQDHSFIEAFVRLIEAEARGGHAQVRDNAYELARIRTGQFTSSMTQTQGVLDLLRRLFNAPPPDLSLPAGWYAPQTIAERNDRIRAALKTIPALAGRRFSVRAGRGTSSAWVDIEGKTATDTAALKAWGKPHDWKPTQLAPRDARRFLLFAETQAGTFVPGQGHTAKSLAAKHRAQREAKAESAASFTVGEVVTLRRGRRRYLVTGIEQYGQTPQYLLYAMSGTDRGSSANVGAVEMTRAADQTLTFSGKEAERRKRRALRALRQPSLVATGDAQAVIRAIEGEQPALARPKPAPARPKPEPARPKPEPARPKPEPASVGTHPDDERKPVLEVPPAELLDRTRRELHNRAAKAIGTGNLAGVYHGHFDVLASNGVVTSEFRATSPSACERWGGVYGRRGQRIELPGGYPSTDVRETLHVGTDRDEVDLRTLKRYTKLAKGRPLGIVRKKGIVWAVAGEVLVDGEPIRQDKALGAVKLGTTAHGDAAAWVLANGMTLALATRGQKRGLLTLPDPARIAARYHPTADAVRVEIPGFGERHAVMRLTAPALGTIAVKIGPPPAPPKKTCTPPDEGQWAALSCKAGRIRVEHFDSERAANEYLAELDGPEWGYTAQVTDLYRAEKSA